MYVRYEKRIYSICLIVRATVNIIRYKWYTATDIHVAKIATCSIVSSISTRFNLKVLPYGCYMYELLFNTHATSAKCRMTFCNKDKVKNNVF